MRLLIDRLPAACGAILVLATSGCSSTSELDTAADSGPTSEEAGTGDAIAVAAPLATGTIGDVFPTVEHLLFDVNIQDGFVEYENDTYAIDTASGHLDYTHETGASGPAVVTTDAVDATPEQVSTLVDAVRAATWRMQRELSECPEQSYVFADGAASAPSITVTGGQQVLAFGVSNASCATSKHSAHGMVIGDAVWNQIFTVLLGIRPGGKRPSDNCW